MSSSSINELLKNLYENKNEDADVTFLVHGVVVKAHKIIIGERCKAFKNIVFRRASTDSKGRYVVVDEKISVESFKEFVKWVYLDESEISYENLRSMLRIANKYMLSTLKKKCLGFVSRACLEHHEIIRCCELALEVEEECPAMWKFCLNLIANNFRKKYFCQILRRHKNRASPVLIERIAKDCPRNDHYNEQFIFSAIVGWAYEECKQQNLEPYPDGMKSILTPIAKHMNLRKVSYSDLHHLYPERVTYIF